MINVKVTLKLSIADLSWLTTPTFQDMVINWCHFSFTRPQTWHLATKHGYQSNGVEKQQMCLYIAMWGPVLHAANDTLIIETSQKANYKLTLNERWNPVTSVILFCTILLRFGVIYSFWLMCGGDSGFGIWICTSPKDESRFRESPKWSPCAGWWAWCGVLNGTPATMQHTSRLHPILAVNKQQQNRRETLRVKLKFNSRLRHHS